MAGPSETEVAAPVVAYLRDIGWTVYQEVDAIAGRADIVGVKGSLLWVVEAKTRLSLALIGQAFRWLRYANYVSIAVPGKRGDEGTTFAHHLLGDMGIGIFHSRWLPCAEWPETVRERARAIFHRNVDSEEIRKRLMERQQTESVAGTQGGHWTPFKETCRNLSEFLHANDGAKLSEAIRAIKHHYRTPTSAVGSMRTWIEQRKVPGVKLVDGRVFLESR